MKNPAQSLFRLNAICLLGFTLSAATTLLAQEGDVSPVSTERPSVGASLDLVPKGSLQLENGVNLTARSGQYIADLPENFVRYGLSKRVELRFLTSNMTYHSDAAPDAPLFHSQDLGVSAKFALPGKSALMPKTAIAYVGMPTGSVDTTTGSYDPGVALLWAQGVHGYTVIEQAQATLTSLEGARRPLWAPSVSAGHALTRNVAYFLEYAPSVLPDNSLTHVVDGGFTVTLKGLRQFDVRTGYIKDADGVHALVSLGYTIRRDHFFSSRRF